MGPRSSEATKPAGRRASVCSGVFRLRLGSPVLSQNSFFGNCMLRTRLKWRFTAAAFLRLRSAVGFS